MFYVLCCAAVGNVCVYAPHLGAASARPCHHESAPRGARYQHAQRNDGRGRARRGWRAGAWDKARGQLYPLSLVGGRDRKRCQEGGHGPATEEQVSGGCGALSFESGKSRTAGPAVGERGGERRRMAVACRWKTTGMRNKMSRW